MKNIEIKEKEYKLVEKITKLKIKDDIFLYKEESSCNKKGNQYNYSKEYFGNKHGTLKPLYLVTDKYIEDIKKWGQLKFFNDKEVFKSGELFKNIDNKDTKIVELDGGCHLIFDIDGNPIPHGIIFNYMHGNIDNKHYRLEDLLEYLSKREDISFFFEGRSRLSKISPKIDDIPYYNKECGRNFTINFIWLPSDKDFYNLWELCKEIKESRYHLQESRYNLHNPYLLIKNKDLLGIEQFRRNCDHPF